MQRHPLTCIPILYRILSFDGRPRTFSEVNSICKETVNDYGHDLWKEKEGGDKISNNRLKRAAAIGNTTSLECLTQILEFSHRDITIRWHRLLAIALYHGRIETAKYILTKGVDLFEPVRTQNGLRYVNICHLIGTYDNIELLELVFGVLSSDQIMTFLQTVHSSFHYTRHTRFSSRSYRYIYTRLNLPALAQDFIGDKDCAIHLFEQGMSYREMIAYSMWKILPQHPYEISLAFNTLRQEFHNGSKVHESIDLSMFRDIEVLRECATHLADDI